MLGISLTQWWNFLAEVPIRKGKGKAASVVVMNSAQRRKLADISNLNREEETQLFSSNEYAEKLQKAFPLWLWLWLCGATLLLILFFLLFAGEHDIDESSSTQKVSIFYLFSLCFACQFDFCTNGVFLLFCGFSKIIELSGVEFQKLKINLRKVQENNLQLAQANTHMLAVWTPIFFYSLQFLRWLCESLKTLMIKVCFFFISWQELNTNRDRVCFFLNSEVVQKRGFDNFFVQLTLCMYIFSSSYFSMNLAARMYYSGWRKCSLRQVIYSFSIFPLIIAT